MFTISSLQTSDASRDDGSIKEGFVGLKLLIIIIVPYVLNFFFINASCFLPAMYSY